ncbi:hypothetical protein CCACVL1_27472 [Corchorus capsularis]|uniref:Uncharacterized protein n=1 Tax=Corchorus capsularis TaxID=210143 RepID=A0A1R3G9Z2_COCAP|nr:hypothetical protein CCACVL1_27472 [Corchorus capsularis]
MACALSYTLKFKKAQTQLLPLKAKYSFVRTLKRVN